MKKTEEAEEGNVSECITTAEAAISEQEQHDGKDEQGGYISLQKAIRTLEAAV